MSATPANSNYQLDHQAIHVWQMDLSDDDTASQPYLNYLNTTEKQRATRYYFDRHRNRFIQARGQLRLLLSRYLHCQPTTIKFAYSEYDKPYLDPTQHPTPLNFNLSHSDKKAVLAISLIPEMGIDIEKIDPERATLEIAKRFFSADEYQALSTLPTAQQCQGFFNAWTRKEAFIKAIGEGLSHALDSFSVTLVPEQQARFISIDRDPMLAQQWQLQTFNFTDEYVGAIAARCSKMQLSFLTI